MPIRVAANTNNITVCLVINPLTAITVCHIIYLPPYYYSVMLPVVFMIALYHSSTAVSFATFDDFF